MKSTEILVQEHDIILKVIEAARRELQHIDKTSQIHKSVVAKLVDFFGNFADKCHHSKEEKLLFTKMEEKGLEHDVGPIAVMLQEHDEGRKRVRSIKESLPDAAKGDSSTVASLRKNLAAYITLLKEHIDKENNVLYPLAERLLTSQDDELLTEAFERVEQEEMGEGVHEKYHHLAHELEES